MGRVYVGYCLLIAGLLTGCASNRKPPYANDPVLLHYKPTLADSATILAEKQTKPHPVQPPMPATLVASAPADPPATKPMPDPLVQPATAVVSNGLLPPPPGAGDQL